MFTEVDDASKVGLVQLVRQLHIWGFRMMDCQQSSLHVLRLGAEEIPRRDYIEHVTAAVTLPGRLGPWQFHG
jgi:leucyl/phenylalanyl-tRNA--protein transferase